MIFSEPLRCPREDGIFGITFFGGMAKMAYALDLGSGGVIRAGSTPVTPTNYIIYKIITYKYKEYCMVCVLIFMLYCVIIYV